MALTLRKVIELTRAETEDRLFKQTGFAPRTVFMLASDGRRLIGPTDHQSHILTLPLVVGVRQSEVIDLFDREAIARNLKLVVSLYRRTDDGAIGCVGFPNDMVQWKVTTPRKLGPRADMLARRLNLVPPGDRGMYVARSRLVEFLIEERLAAMTSRDSELFDADAPVLERLGSRS